MVHFSEKVFVMKKWFLLLLAASAPLFGAEAPPANLKPPAVRGITHFALYYSFFRPASKAGKSAYPIQQTDGTNRLTLLPMEGLGPWFNAGYSRWHQNQLQSLMEAGISGVLFYFAGDPNARKDWALTSLDMFVQALIDLKASRKEVPLVALYLDFPLKDTPIDARQPEGKEEIYQAIHDFYQRVPARFRAEVALPGQEDQGGNFVYLGAPIGITACGRDLADYLSRSFEKDFGLPLLVGGDPQWISKGADLPFTVSMDSAKVLNFSSAERDQPSFRVVAICPSYNNAGLLGKEVPVRFREGGRPYIAAWNTIGSQKVDLVFINSWNGFHNGTAIAPTRQYGRREMDLTRAALSRWENVGQYGVKILKTFVPDRMAPGSIQWCEFKLQNIGSNPWVSILNSLRYQLSSSDGSVQTSGKVNLPREVAPRDIVTLGIGVPLLDTKAQPLPEGQYLLRFTLAVGPNESIVLPLVTKPVAITPNTRQVLTLLDSSLPRVLRSGASYRVNLRVRNETKDLWAKNTYSLVYRWILNRGGKRTILGIGPTKTPLPQNLVPGEQKQITVNVTVATVGKPLEPWSPEVDWNYEIEWGIEGPEGPQFNPEEVSQNSREVVEVRSFETAVEFPYGAGLPTQVEADKPYEAKAVIRNLGPDTWQKGDLYVSHQWYYWDGVPLTTKNSEKIPLEPPLGELKPGEETLVRMKVQSPPFAGPYLLLWQVWYRDRLLSDLPVFRGTPLMPSYTMVSGGPLKPVNLAEAFDEDGFASELDPSNGNLDGNGTTIPSDLVPPEVTPMPQRPNIFPCGYLGRLIGVGYDANRHIPFQWPEKRDDQKNLLTCNGQRLDLRLGGCNRVHLAALALEDTEGDFTLHFSDGTQQSQRILFSASDSPPHFGEHSAFSLSLRLNRQKVERVPVYINHYVLEADPRKELVGITLPSNPSIKILALTLESW